MTVSRRRFLGLAHPMTSAGSPSLVARVGDACLARMGVTCEVCRDACDIQAIQLVPAPGLPSAPVINVTCTGCAACVTACPANAIQLLEREAACV